MDAAGTRSSTRGAASGAAGGPPRRTASGGAGAAGPSTGSGPLPRGGEPGPGPGDGGAGEEPEPVYEAIHFEGNPQECGHVVTTACVRPDGQRHILRYAAERVVGNGSFGVVFQATCVETRETVAIKRVLQDKRFKNRELQIMRLLDHPNVVQLKHSFFSTADRDDVYLNLVLEYVPDTVYRIIKHYAKRNQVRSRPAARPPVLPPRRTRQRAVATLPCLALWPAHGVAVVQGDRVGSGLRVGGQGGCPRPTLSALCGNPRQRGATRRAQTTPVLGPSPCRPSDTRADSLRARPAAARHACSVCPTST
jgi:hypothetical protein